jgi:hypothetical protein
MKNKEELIKSLSILFYSWGSDTPDEVYWGANQLLGWIEEEYSVKLNIRFERDEVTYETNFDDVIDAINSL